MQDLSPVGAEALASLRPPAPALYVLPYGIEILVSPAGGIITSQLGTVLGLSIKGQSATDALEGLLLAMACQGVNVSTPQMACAVSMAIEALRQKVTPQLT